ncbi:MAG TPA: SDR family NAD(P)-dependent oxidoreductase [Terriglobales bacterium]|jgi:NAD(P)-dependent dehydrogenase (short-subunit alcohol dehydrogenase family)|nr:SDR family NAD(P)-dependent oxidoreductase [Terriglobales bacterium]
MTAKFSDKLALIAGGTGGLGRAVTLGFLEEGAKVVVTYQKQEEFDAVKNAAGSNGPSLEGRPVDVTDEAAVRQLIESIVARHNRLDVLVNSVGSFAVGKLWELDTKVFDLMLALNVRSGYVLARAVTPVMLKQKSGAIVNVASRAALDHPPGLAAYAASKAAALALMDSLAAEVKGTGMRVNSILPSIIDTEVNRKAMPGADFAKWPKPEEIARVILFLSSDDAKLIHGAAVPVYGDS